MRATLSSVRIPARDEGVSGRRARSVQAAVAMSFAALLAAGGTGAAEPIHPVPEAIELDRDKVALGRDLFHEPRLSKDGSVSCASCHDLARGGGDGRRVSIGIEGRLGVVNSPTVFNAVFNFKQFWDGRANTVEDQIDGPVQSPIEMGSIWSEVVAKLCRVEDWRVGFRVRWLVRRFRSGPQSGSRGYVSSPRSSNRACGFPAHGSRTRSCLRPRKAGRSRSKADKAMFCP